MAQNFASRDLSSGEILQSTGLKKFHQMIGDVKQRVVIY